MEVTTHHALFQAAVDGDLDALSALFEQSSVCSIIVRVNDEHRRVRESSVASHKSPFVRDAYASISWYFYSCSDPHSELNGFLFAKIIQHEQTHVFEWLLSNECISDTLYALFHRLLRCLYAMEVERSACFLELFLESHLFARVFTPSDRRCALQEMLKGALCRRRDDLMRLIVAHGGNVSTRETIQSCAAWGNKSCFGKMIDNGLVGTDFTRVVGFRDAGVTRLLIAHGMDVRYDSSNWKPLHDAIRSSCNDVVEALVTVGCADVNASVDGLTPLMIAVEDRFNVPSTMAIASILLANGADAFKQRPRSGDTVLHVAARSCPDVRVLTLLVTHSPTLANTRNKGGDTALHVVIQTNHVPSRLTSLLDCLLSCGADPFLLNHRGQSPHDLLMMTEQGRKYVVSRINYFGNASHQLST